MRLKLRSFCSKTKVPFFVLIEVEGDLMRWIGASPLPPRLDSSFYSGSDQLLVSREYRVDATGWTCPICRAGASGGYGEFWHCGSCNEYHCMGTSAGILNGRCGRCKIDPKNLKRMEVFGIRGVGTSE